MNWFKRRKFRERCKQCRYFPQCISKDFIELFKKDFKNGCERFQAKPIECILCGMTENPIFELKQVQEPKYLRRIKEKSIYICNHCIDNAWNDRYPRETGIFELYYDLIYGWDLSKKQIKRKKENGEI